MNPKDRMKWVLISSFLFVLLSGCAAPLRVATEPPPFPEGFLNAKWASSVEDVKKAVKTDGNLFFKDNTADYPFTLYASGQYLNSPAIFSYFFTPKSKKLYRTDVTFSDLGVYGGVREDLIQRFTKPSFSQKDVDHWSWLDKSLIILQKDVTHVQISFSNGSLLVLNQREGEGGKRP